MELEVGGVGKAFIAMCALKGSLTRMGAFMLQTEIKKTKNKEVKEEKWRK